MTRITSDPEATMDHGALDAGRVRLRSAERRPDLADARRAAP